MSGGYGSGAAEAQTGCDGRHDTGLRNFCQCGMRRVPEKSCRAFVPFFQDPGKKIAAAKLRFFLNGWRVGSGGLLVIPAWMQACIEECGKRRFGGGHGRVLIFELKHRREQRAHLVRADTVFGTADEFERAGRQLPLEFSCQAGTRLQAPASSSLPGSSIRLMNQGVTSTESQAPLKGRMPVAATLSAGLRIGTPLMRSRSILRKAASKPRVSLLAMARSRAPICVSTPFAAARQSLRSSSTMKPSRAPSHTGQVQCPGNFENGVPGGICQ